MGTGPDKNWTQYLDDEDLSFIKRFVLASGSLKKLAGDYGVSYPTVRLRLDRVIAKVEIIESQAEATDFERLLAASYAGGRMDMATFKTLKEAYLKERENPK